MTGRLRKCMGKVLLWTYTHKGMCSKCDVINS